MTPQPVAPFGASVVSFFNSAVPAMSRWIHGVSGLTKRCRNCAAVIDPVWALLTAAYERIGRPVPTCLERDFNIPDLAALSAEVGHIARLQSQAAGRQRQVA